MIIGRTALACGTAAALLLGVPAAGGAEPTSDGARPLEIVDVSPSVAMLVNDHGSNVTCVSLPSGLVFVDAGQSTEMARRFRRAMEERFGQPTRALFLTHAHIDHLLGMGAFADVDVIAAESARPLFERQLEIELDEATVASYAAVFRHFAEDAEAAAPFLPTLWFSEKLILGNSARELVLRHTGGHSVDSSHAVLASEGVVVAGDLLQVDRYPYFGDPTTDLDAWVRTLDAWRARQPKALCPGHGPAVDGEYLDGVAGYFRELLSVMAHLKADGVAMEQAIVHPSVPTGYWPAEATPPRWWRHCLALAYLQAEEPAAE